MARHIHFGNHFYMQFLRIIHNVLYLFLRIAVGAVRLAGLILLLSAVVGDDHVGSRGADGCQKGIFVHRQTPSLVASQMPVETVELVIAHHVEHTLYLIGREEVTADIEHESAITVGRTVLYGNHGQLIAFLAGIIGAGHNVGR